VSRSDSCSTSIAAAIEVEQLSERDTGSAAQGKVGSDPAFAPTPA